PNCGGALAPEFQSASVCNAGARICVGGTNGNISCTSNVDCGTGGTCTALTLLNGSGDVTDDLYGPGSCIEGYPRSVECPQGVCVAGVSEAHMNRAYAQLLDLAAARTGTSTVKPILVAGWDGLQSGAPFKKCIKGSNHGSSCSSDANCPGGACKLTAYFERYKNPLDPIRAWHNWIIQTAENRGLPYIDLGGYMRRLAAGNIDENLRDHYHLSTIGLQRAADLMSACLKRDTSIPENHCDDLTSEALPRHLYTLDLVTAPLAWSS